MHYVYRSDIFQTCRLSKHSGPVGLITIKYHESKQGEKQEKESPCDHHLAHLPTGMTREDTGSNQEIFSHSSSSGKI